MLLMEVEALFARQALRPRLIVVPVDLAQSSSTNRHSSGKLGATSEKFLRPCARQFAISVANTPAAFGAFLDRASHI
jgi:hypothetical protein